MRQPYARVNFIPPVNDYMNLVTGNKDSKLTCSESIRLTSPEFDMIYCMTILFIEYFNMSTFLGPKWHSLSAQCHFTGPKKSLFPGPNPLPLALVMDAARIKSITHGAV